MHIEKREGGIYFKFLIHIMDFDPYLSAVYTLEWYIDYLNKKLDTDRYSFILTHNECLFSIKLTEAETKCCRHKEHFLNKANYEIEKAKPLLISLSNGKIPDIIRKYANKQFNSMLSEWKAV